MGLSGSRDCPEHHAIKPVPSSLCTSSCLKRPLILYTQWNVSLDSLDKMLATLIWSMFGWSSQRNNSPAEMLSDPQGQHASNSRNFLHCYSSPVSLLLFKALASMENVTLWQVFVLRDPWPHTEGSAQACLQFNCYAFLAWWESDMCLSWALKRNMYSIWHLLDVMVTISAISKWLLRLKSPLVQSSWNSMFSFIVFTLAMCFTSGTIAKWTGSQAERMPGTFSFKTWGK